MGMSQHLNNYVGQAHVADLQRRAQLARRSAGTVRPEPPARSGMRRGLLVVARLARATR
jgi:hypothetical protein